MVSLYGIPILTSIFRIPLMDGSAFRGGMRGMAPGPLLDPPLLTDRICVDVKRGPWLQSAGRTNVPVTAAGRRDSWSPHHAVSWRIGRRLIEETNLRIRHCGRHLLVLWQPVNVDRLLIQKGPRRDKPMYGKSSVLVIALERGDSASHKMCRNGELALVLLTACWYG